MREIKFRGKRIDNDKWIYGFYVKYETRQICVIGDDKLGEDEIIHLIACDGFADWNMPKQLNFTKVKKETVNQFTGLLDKNGVEIFEGDLLKWSSKNAYDEIIHQVNEVKWLNGCFVVTRDNEPLYDYLKFEPSYEKIEIIGNIHEVQHV